MKILVVGFPKTGTKSLDKALEILGYKVSGFQRTSTEMIDDWICYMDGKGTLEDLKKMYKGYDAATATPVFHYWKDFLKVFPDIKVFFFYYIHSDKTLCIILKT